MQPQYEINSRVIDEAGIRSSNPEVFMSDPFNLQRFVDAQAPVWDNVQSELAHARKVTHWMWFVFPQLAVLGRSSTAQFYGISGAEEARAYLQHLVLGPRLMQCCALLLQARAVSAREIFGEVDAMKLRSCLTLFEACASEKGVFAKCLDRYFDSSRDALTLRALAP